MSGLAEHLIRAAEVSVDDNPDPAAEAIVDAAMHQFELSGIARSTMQEIARRANAARVTVYRRFPSKDALIEAVMMRELRGFMVEFDSALDQYDSLDDRVVEGFVFVLEAMRGHRLLRRVLEREPETILPMLTTQGSTFVDAAREALLTRLRLDVSAQDQRSPAELAIIADVIIRLLMSFLLTPMTLIDLDDTEQARAFALRYLRPILIGDPPAS